MEYYSAIKRNEFESVLMRWTNHRKKSLKICNFRRLCFPISIFMTTTLIWVIIMEMAAHSRTLAWEIPWTEKPGGYSPWYHKELDMT